MALIMVIDNEPDFLDITKVALEKNGYEAITAISGEEGLKILETTKPDLILLDIMMPDMDGWETLELIRRMEGMAEIPVIMLTVKGVTYEALEKEEELDVVDYITKPFSYKDILKIIQKTIGGSDSL